MLICHSFPRSSYLAGAQIIDMIILVIDANKGIQAQTSECIIISELCTDKMIIVLNKIDTLPGGPEREERLMKVTHRIRKVFEKTKFAECPILRTAATIGGEKVAVVGGEKSKEGSSNTSNSGNSKGEDKSDEKEGEAVTAMLMSNKNQIGISDLVELLRTSVTIPTRRTDLPFYYAIDHCFPIKVLMTTIITSSVITTI